MNEVFETIIVGGGQAGLAASYYLTQASRPHVVLERSSHVVPAWRDQRWDSFTLVTPNWTVRMPGAEYNGPDPDAFLTRNEVVDYFDNYVARFRLPIRFDVAVESITRDAPGRYVLTTSSGTIEGRNVIVAIGLYQRPRIPGFAARLPRRILQLHSSQYRNPAALPDGAVLVVGAGQSGAQIAEELYQSGRRVFLSVGRTVRTPRRYRSRDIHRWSEKLGLFDRTVDQLKSPQEKFEVHPTISGRAGGRTLNLHQFMRDGVVLLGRLKRIEDETLVLGSDLRDNLAEADQFEKNTLEAIDKYVAGERLDVPSEQLSKKRDGYEAPTISRLKPDAVGITSMIWASGYSFDFSLIRLPVCDTDGYPKQKRGVSDFSGLYFLGLPWLHSRKSGLLFGVGEDAAFIVSNLTDSKEARQ